MTTRSGVERFSLWKADAGRRGEEDQHQVAGRNAQHRRESLPEPGIGKGMSQTSSKPASSHAGTNTQNSPSTASTDNTTCQCFAVLSVPTNSPTTDSPREQKRRRAEDERGSSARRCRGACR